MPLSGVIGSSPSSSHLLCYLKTLQGWLCHECEKLPQVRGHLGGAWGSMGGRKENTPFFCPGPHPVQTAPSFPRSFLPLRIGTEALRRVSQQHKSRPCLLPPPPSPQGLNTSVPKLSESGRSPRGHLPVYLSQAMQATAAQMSLEASLPVSRRPDQVDSLPSSWMPAMPPRWLSTGRALVARYHSRDSTQGPAEPLPASLGILSIGVIKV